MTTAVQTVLRAIDTEQMVDRVAGWLAEPANAQWLDFADGQKCVTPLWVKMVARSSRHLLRVFTSEAGDPIGVVALGAIDRTFKTANLWFVLGDKAYARRGFTTRAAAEIMRVGFLDLGLHAINTWTVDGNPSANIIRRLQFTEVGRQRECHRIDGVARDRLLFDILASDYRRVAV